MPKVKTYKCQECGKVYKTERGLNAHLDKGHPAIAEEPLQDRTLELAEERNTIPNEQPLPVKESVAEVETETHPTFQQDAKKVWLSKYKWWIIGGVALLLLWFVVIAPAIEKQQYDSDLERVGELKATVRQLEAERDSIIQEQKGIDSMAVLAIDMYHEAKQEADAANEAYQLEKRKANKTFSDINNRSNETQIRINKASSIRSLDSLYEEITSSGRFKVHENK